MIRKSLLSMIVTAFFALTTVASAQYMGPGGMGGISGAPGAPTYTKKSYGVNKAAMAAVIGGGIGGGVLLLRHHRHTMTACVGSDGATLDDGKDIYTLVGNSLTPGERIVATGKKLKSESGTPAFELRSVRKDLGRCEQQSVVAAQK